MVTHVSRYDDFSACSSTAVEEKLVELLLRLRVPCTFAVIPFVCDPESLLAGGEVRLLPLPEAKARLLKPLLDAGLAEIALHGYCHLALAPVRGYQEFSDRMPRETQQRLVQQGRRHLEQVFGTKVRLYVPPWNRLAASTVPVLAEEGLLLSGDLPETLNSDSFTLAQLPCATGIGGTSCALRTARRWGRGGGVVGTTFHDYDFVESGHDVANLSLKQFEVLVCQWKESSDVASSSISPTILELPATETGRLRANTMLRQAMSRSRIGRKMLPGLREVFWDEQTASRLASMVKFVP